MNTLSCMTSTEILRFFYNNLAKVGLFFYICKETVKIMAQTSIITGQYVRINQQAATLLQRGLAWLIDYTAIWISATIILAVILGLASSFGISNDDFLIILMFVAMIPLVAYPLIMEYFFNGQSLGKMVLKIRVVSLDGSKPSATALMLRWLLLLVDMTLGVGLVAIIFTKNSQRLGDLAAGTAVVTLEMKFAPNMLQNVYFAQNDYRPTYPEANRLTMRQVDTIERVLFMQYDEKRAEYINTLAGKLQQMLGIRPRNNNMEQFVSVVYNDFQYYTTRVI